MRSIAKLGRVFLLWLVVAALLTPSALAEGGQITIGDARAESFPKVTVRLTAVDDAGAPVGGLESEDFVVEENGRRIESLIAYPLRQTKTPLSIVMAIDVSGSMNDASKMPKAREAARTFISQLRAVDRVELLAFSTSVTTVVPFTNDRAALGKGLDSLAAKGDTALYDATDRAVASAVQVESNRVVVVLTDGEDTVSRSPLAQSLGLAAQKGVPIYTIGLGDDVKDDVLTRMAKETSGRYFKAPTADDLELTFKLLSRQIENSYELVYHSPLTQETGAKVDVAVRVVGDELEGVEARFSYQMPAVRPVDAPVPVDPGQLQLVPEPPAPQPTPELPQLPPYWAELAGLAGGSAILSLFVGLVLRVTQDTTATRMATFVESAVRPGARRRTGPQGGQLFIGLMRSLAGVVNHVLPSRQVQETRRSLILAGNPYGWEVEEFTGVRVLCGATLGLVGYLAFVSRGPLLALAMALALGLLGFLLPLLWLRSRIRARQHEIFKAMPNALDLLSVSVEAGLGFDQALGEVCQKWHNALTQEFATLLGELQMGRSRREALRGLMDRTGVPEVGGFASALIQADELGASISRTLAIQAEQIRIKRRQRAEEQAHKAAVKMLFPLVFLMFPSLFIVILGPAVPSILQAFGQVGK